MMTNKPQKRLFVKLVLVSMCLALLSYPNQSYSRTTLTGTKSRLKTAKQSGAQSAALRNLVNSADKVFSSVKLPPMVAQSAAALSIVSGSQARPVGAQNYLGGPEAINAFAMKIIQAKKDGLAAAGLPQQMSIAQAEGVIAGLLTGILLLEKQQVPSCAMGPIRVGDANVQGCVSEQQDTQALKVYFNRVGVKEKDMELYSKARRLMVAMMAGAGLQTYRSAATHQPGVESAYAALWLKFLDKINSQGVNVKPVVAFVEAFGEVQNNVSVQDRDHPLAFVSNMSPSQTLKNAMDKFFGACALPVGI